jgi:hypothetical protein
VIERAVEGDVNLEKRVEVAISSLTAIVGDVVSDEE